MKGYDLINKTVFYLIIKTLIFYYSGKRIKLEPRNSELNDILSMLINSEEFNSSILSIDTSSYPIKKNEVKKDDPSVKGKYLVRNV